jgi:hypothetical protein
MTEDIKRGLSEHRERRQHREADAFTVLEVLMMVLFFPLSLVYLFLRQREAASRNAGWQVRRAIRRRASTTAQAGGDADGLRRRRG